MKKNCACLLGLLLFVQAAAQPDAAAQPEAAAQPAAEPPPEAPPYPPPPPPIEPPPPPLPFGQGTSMGGLVLGIGSGGGQTSFAFGGSFAYFVVDGVAPGLSTVVTASTAAPNTLELAPFVRLVPIRAYPVSPLLVVKGGRLFVDGAPSVWELGGGGGLVYFASPRYALLGEVVYLRYLPNADCTPDCSHIELSIGFGVFF